MKRILAILCVIAVLCGLCVPAMAAAVDLGGLNSLALVGTGVPGAADWNPGDAAGDFTKVSDGVYVKVISVTAGHAMSFKIAGNDAWDDAYNFGGMEDGVTVALGTKIDLANGGGSKDISLTAAKDGNLKFTVDLNGDVPTLLVEETTDDATVAPPSEPDEPGEPGEPGEPSTPSGETITVYAKVPAEWTDVRVWAWDDSLGDADPSGWPGTLVMTMGDDGWYSVQVPNWVTGMLINANNATVQTPDVSVEAGKNVWIDALTSPNSPTAYYSEPDISDPPPTEPPTSGSDHETIAPIEDPEEGSIDWGKTLLYVGIGSGVVILISAVVLVLILVLKKKRK